MSKFAWGSAVLRALDVGVVLLTWFIVEPGVEAALGATLPSLVYPVSAALTAATSLLLFAFVLSRPKFEVVLLRESNRNLTEWAISPSANKTIVSCHGKIRVTLDSWGAKLFLWLYMRGSFRVCVELGSVPAVFVPERTSKDRYGSSNVLSNSAGGIDFKLRDAHWPNGGDWHHCRFDLEVEPLAGPLDVVIKAKGRGGRAVHDALFAIFTQVQCNVVQIKLE